MCEEILADLSASDPRWLTMSLRYTNPSGAHPSGYIGEVSNPHGYPAPAAAQSSLRELCALAQDPTNAANLMPVVTQVLQGRREQVKVSHPSSVAVLSSPDRPCLCSHRSLARTMTRPMGRACATTFTSLISPGPTSPPSGIWPRVVQRATTIPTSE